MLKGDELTRAVEASVKGYRHENIGFTSLDVRLSSHLKVESPTSSIIDISAKHPDSALREFDASKYLLAPNEFITGKLIEKVEMPSHLSAMFTLRSCMAQNGLEQSTSVWVRPGWEGNLVVELKNFYQRQTLLLRAGMIIGQFHFFRCEG